MKNFVQKKVFTHVEGSEKYKIGEGIAHPESDLIVIDFIRSHTSSGAKILEVVWTAVFLLTSFLKLQ